MFPLINIAAVPNGEVVQHHRVVLLKLIQKHIRKRGLMGLIEKPAILLVKEHTNDNRLKASFNYLMQAGNTTHSDKFLHEIAERLLQHKDELMAITEGL